MSETLQNNSNITKCQLIKGQWTKEEDELLFNLRCIRKIKTWTNISKYFKNKNPKQCSYRFKKIYEDMQNSTKNQQFIKGDEFHKYNFDNLKYYFPNKLVNDMKNKNIPKKKHITKTFSPKEDLAILNIYSKSQIWREVKRARSAIIICLFEESIYNYLDVAPDFHVL